MVNNTVNNTGGEAISSNNMTLSWAHTVISLGARSLCIELDMATNHFNVYRLGWAPEHTKRNNF